MATMNISFVNIHHYYRLVELCKLLQRLIIGYLKIILILLLMLTLLAYLKYSKSGFDSKWSFSSYHFDDSLDEMRDNLQYAVIIDAGSSGSRVYIYVWPPHTGDTRSLLNIRLLHDQLGKNVQHSITPGLSSCSDDPSRASSYIAPLLDFARDNIPLNKHKETPLYILATAGMRLLDDQTQNLILEDLRRDIPANYSFQFALNNVQVISGKEEGIYSWISINYLMGRFDHTLEKAPLVNVEFDKGNLKRMSTISMLEMGGASVQIAFEITSNQQFDNLKSRFSEESFKKMVTEFNLGCSEHDTNHHYRLFVDTYLTLGANAARNEYIDYLIHTEFENPANHLNSSLTTREAILFDPCLCIDSSETVSRTLPPSLLASNSSSQSTQFLYHLKGSGDFDKCQDKLRKLVTQDALHICSNGTCPFQNLQNLSVPFKETDFYGLSEFWYSMNDVYGMGGQYNYNKFVKASQKYCSTSWLVSQDRWRRGLYPNADNKRLLHQCFKSSWITAILHDGFKMPQAYGHFKSVAKLNNQPVQWTLGALIFRTRFFPLRSMDNQHGVHIHGGHVVKQSSTYSFQIQFTLFVLCIVAVLTCIVVYIKHLHRMTNNSSKTMAANYYRPLATVDIETQPLYANERVQDHSVFIGFK